MRAAKLTICAGAAVALIGCGGLRLYDKSSDQVATTAKADFESAKVQDALKTEQATFDALERRQVEAFIKSVSVERDLALLSVMSSGSSSFVSRLKDITGQRISQIVDGAASPTDAQLDKAGSLLRSIREKRRGVSGNSAEEATLRAQLTRLSDQFAKLPTCSPASKSLYEGGAKVVMRQAEQNKDFKAPTPLPNTYQSYVEACKTLLDSQDYLKEEEQKITGGQLKLSAIYLKSAKDRLDADQASATTAKAALKEASSKFVSLSSTIQSSEESKVFTCEAAKTTENTKPGAYVDATAAAVKSPSGQFCDALARLESLGDVGKKIISEERLAKIEVLLAAASGKLEPSADAEVTSSLLLLDTSVRFGNSLNTYRKQRKLPALEPLIIEKQMATAKLDLATKGIELRRLHVQYQQDMYDALLLEATILFRARAQADSIKVSPGGCAGSSAQRVKSTAGAAAGAAASGQKASTRSSGRSTNDAACATLGEILATPKMQAQISSWQKEGKAGSAVEEVEEPALRSAYRALAYLAESYSVAKTRYRSAEMRSILLAYRESALRSESALAAWSGLVTTPIDQVKTYHSTGLKPDEIAQFLQAFGLLGIAHGVR